MLSHLSAANQHALIGRSFFPNLISQPFQSGLHAAFDFAILVSLIAAGGIMVTGWPLRVRRAGVTGTHGGGATVARCSNPRQGAPSLVAKGLT